MNQKELMTISLLVVILWGYILYVAFPSALDKAANHAQRVPNTVPDRTVIQP